MFLWQQGIKRWQDFLTVGKIKGISKTKKYYYDRILKEAQQALLENDPSFFINKLPKIEMWRLYDHFREESGFLDVEVDSYGNIIVVGISDYYQSNVFIKGVNLERKVIEKEISKFKLIITFNGSSFDLPKLKKQIGIELQVPHIDLKPLCTNLGWKGGLKEVESELNLKRPNYVKGSPAGLWKAFHASGDKEYLELLIDYNREDIENLRGIINSIYHKLSEKLYKQINSP